MHIISPTHNGHQKVTVYDLNNDIYREGTFSTRLEAQQMAELWQRQILFSESASFTIDDIINALNSLEG